MNGNEKPGAEIPAPETHPKEDVSPAERVTRRGGTDSASTQGEASPLATLEYRAYLQRQARGTPQPPRFADGFPEEAMWVDVEGIVGDPELPEIEEVTPEGEGEGEPYDAAAHELDAGEGESEVLKVLEAEIEKPEATGSPESDEVPEGEGVAPDPEQEVEDPAQTVSLTVAEVETMEIVAAELRDQVANISRAVSLLSFRLAELHEQEGEGDG